MKAKKIVISLLILNIIVFSAIFISGLKYLVSESEANVVSVDINQKEKIIDLKADVFVDVREYIPDIEVELRYATNKNVLGKVLYENDNVYLRKGTADKLKAANYEFKKLGYKIKIWDAYRPTAVQRLLWNQINDNRYIANPKGGSIHNRGAAVDITLVDKIGKEIFMPTGFDEFNKYADRNYGDVAKEKVDNAKLLEGIMKKCGFESIYTEWWHFDDKEWKQYAIVDKVVKENVALLNNEPVVTNELSIDEERSFFEKLQAGIENISMDKIKNQFDYQIVKIKSLFNSYKSNE